ncbi:sigma D regulator [Aliidiomarina iranensis]|uniref:Sigma D regulator n=1 Tax=Aliidiomarina iranensis TaxID=1434071 RepID=A0A432VRT0_9GAMM|nr:sigma D regulator [Aliidiomarina iranensis]RUO19017.1 sigma D regulator [Aliidiomarina iranensis]
MLSRNQAAKEQWAGLHQALDRWLDERQDLLVRYCKLAGLPPYNSKTGQLPAANDIREFCEVLVDYVSAGHFELYDHILEEASAHNQSTLALGKKVFPLISDTTEVALSFHDTYAEVTDTDSLPKFTYDLSNLGEALQNRLELEDKLIALLEEHEVIGTEE